MNELNKKDISKINSECTGGQGVFSEPNGIPNEIKESVIYMRRVTGGRKTTLFRLKEIYDKYLLAKNIEIAGNMNLLKEGTVVFISFKQKEFVEFVAYYITKVSSKYVTFISTTGNLDYTYFKVSGYEKRYFINVKESKEHTKIEKEEFIVDIGKYLKEESSVEIYTFEEFKDFKMLSSTEKDNLIYTDVLTGELEKLNKKYETLRF